MPNAEFIHCALLYRSAEEFLDGVLEFVSPALDAGEPVVVALDEDKLRSVTGRLGAPRWNLELIDMHGLGHNPARLIPLFRRVHEEHGGGAMHFVGEPVRPDQADEEVAEALVHEALMNLAFEGRPVRALCPYDASRLAPDVLAAAHRTHPRLVEAHDTITCAEYRDEALPRACREPLASPPPDSTCFAFGLSDLGRVRSLVSEAADRAGLDDERREDMVIAVNELATNSIRHGGGSGELRAWVEPDRLICEVHDAGVIPDPLAGRIQPEPGGAGGRGLWLVHQLTDLAQVRSDNQGTTVRLHAHTGHLV